MKNAVFRDGEACKSVRTDLHSATSQRKTFFTVTAVKSLKS
jgi:hypothetical protein